MKQKVKKFGRGGDILTALGAGLAGYGAYKYFTRDKDKDKGDDYASRVKEYNAKNKPAEEPVSTDKKEPSAGEKRAAQQSKDPRSLLVPEDADKDALYESDKALVRTAPKGNKPAPKTVVPKAAATRTDTTTPKVATSKSSAPDKKESTVSKPYPIKSKPNEGRTTKTSPMMVRDVADKKASDLSVPKGLDLKSTNKTVYGTDTTSVFQKKAAQERADKEAKAKKEAEAEKRRRSRPSSEEMMTQSLGGGFKRGGTIKASKMGSVKTAKPTMRSASSRADGIAIRGKTRA